MSMLRKLFVLLVVGVFVFAVPSLDPAYGDTRVSAVQQELKNLGYNPGPVDGAWGQQTERAARRFMRSKNYNLSQVFRSGRVDVNKLLGLLRSSGTRTATGDVKKIQRLLAQMGYSPGTADGRWDNTVLSAARRFAAARSLSSSIWRPQGRVSYSALLVHLKLAQRAGHRAGRTSVAASGEWHGSAPTRADVRAIEILLGTLGYDPGSRDGVWDAKTLAAVRRFARDRSIDTSIWRPGNRVSASALMVHLRLAKRSGHRAGSTQTASSGSGQAASGGSVSRERLKRIEELLAKVGHDPGPVDGVWNRQSETAARHFARERRIGGRNWGRINREDASIIINQLVIAERSGSSVAGSSSDSASSAAQARPSPSDTRRIETLLSDLEYLSLPPDGTWNATTERAVERFLAANDLSNLNWKNGNRVRTSMLIRRLEIAYRRRDQAQTNTQTANAGTQEYRDQAGLTTLQVRTIKQLLAVLGYDPGSQDNRWDEQMMSAARRFAQSWGLEEDAWFRDGTVVRAVFYNQLRLAQRQGHYASAAQNVPESTGGSTGGSTGESTGETADSLVRTGALALLSRKYDEALAAFSKALEREPGRAEAHDYRGRTYLARGDTTRAIAEFTRAIELNSAFALAHANRAGAHERVGRLTRALEDLAAAVRLEPDNTEYQAALARTAQLLVAAPAASPAPAQASPPPVSVSTETRVALVIGNSRYDNVPSLRNPEGDARAVATSFERLGFSDVTLRFDLGRDELIDALRTFSDKAVTADWAVVYFAGHGFEMGGVNYLVPVDAKLVRDTHASFEAVQLDQLLTAMSGARKLRLAILDACRNNPFTSRMQMSGTRSVGRGLGLIEPEGGTLVAYAARHGQVALDGDGANSPYVSALLQHMATEKLEIGLLFRHVRDTVRQLTGQSQEPYVYGSLPSEALYFNPGGE